MTETAFEKVYGIICSLDEFKMLARKCRSYQVVFDRFEDYDSTIELDLARAMIDEYAYETSLDDGDDESSPHEKEGTLLAILERLLLAPEQILHTFDEDHYFLDLNVLKIVSLISHLDEFKVLMDACEEYQAILDEYDGSFELILGDEMIRDYAFAMNLLCDDDSGIGHRTDRIFLDVYNGLSADPLAIFTTFDASGFFFLMANAKCDVTGEELPEDVLAQFTSMIRLPGVDYYANRQQHP